VEELPRFVSFSWRGLPVLATLAALFVWLWPIGLGGRMPVGGDVTQFSLGLMAFLAEALRAGRLPVWNDLWGYGFPGLAESQMGVYYPPHWVLYGILPLELAYTASLVLHTLFGGLGAFWAARRFGVSPVGSALAGFSWAGCGFYVIHMPHQWGYTTGSWMPWAWGLAWLLVSGRGTRRTPLWLALVLTLQVLPGHFQLAFTTEVGVVLLSLAALAEPGLRRDGAGRGVVATLLALLAVVPLGAMQLGPTWRLARMAASDRDYEYLSGFASTPLHLVSYVAPGLFQRSPLWRPIAWDPFRTSPEEHLAYIGLVPLFLALGVLLRQFRREPAIRVLGVVAAATLLLSLGPYVPGFSLLIRLPGFSFFRAPARWSLATELALCLLAGRGFDLLRTWPRPGWALARFAVGAALAPCLILGLVELALAITEPPGSPELEPLFDTLSARLIPTFEPDTIRVGPWMKQARRRQDDLRVASALARQGVRSFPPRGLSFAATRRSIYARDLGPTAMLLGTLLILSALEHRRRFLEAALLAVTALDLWDLSRERHYDLGPIRPLAAQSPLLRRLTHLPRGSRTLDPAQNLPMVCGTAPLLAYHTLDLPTMGLLTRLAQGLPRDEATSHHLPAMRRATGIAASIHNPVSFARPVGFPGAEDDVPGWSSRERIHDPTLAGWLYGADWVALHDAEVATFLVWPQPPPVTRVWLVPRREDSRASIEAGSGAVAKVLEVFESARPLTVQSTRPERLDVTVDVEGERDASVLITQLADPQWEGRWISSEGRERPAQIRPVFRTTGEFGWQAVDVPGPGRWTLHLEYGARDVHMGLIVSGVSFLVLVGLGVVLRPVPQPVQGGSTS
jgi:hypothetical protein